jgi:hypothetical protein
MGSGTSRPRTQGQHSGTLLVLFQYTPARDWGQQFGSSRALAEAIENTGLSTGVTGVCLGCRDVRTATVDP